MAAGESSWRWVGVSSALFHLSEKEEMHKLLKLWHDFPIATKYYPRTRASLRVTGNSEKKKPPQNNSSFLIL